MSNPSHSERLRELVAQQPSASLYPCIADLAESGVDESRFDGARHPCRQDVTQYLAAWNQAAGIAQEDCLAWLTDYSTEVLAKISSSSTSAIRHSTKSNVKSAYTHCRPFRCEKEGNPFKAHCMPMCPNYNRVYEDEDAARREGLAQARNEAAARPVGGMKAQYQEQFAKAVSLAVDFTGTGISSAEISKRLNDQGFKSRTGKSWTSSMVVREVTAAKGTLPEPGLCAGNGVGGGSAHVAQAAGEHASG